MCQFRTILTRVCQFSFIIYLQERQKKVPEVEMVTHAPTPTNKPPTTSTTGPLDSRFLTKNPKAVPLTQKPAANQKPPQTPPANKIAAPVTNQKTPVASQANQSLAAKRKSETGQTLAESPKKGKFDGPLKVSFKKSCIMFHIAFLGWNKELSTFIELKKGGGGGGGKNFNYKKYNKWEFGKRKKGKKEEKLEKNQRGEELRGMGSI